jgi:DNA-binding response OmpR family regulator
MNNRIVICEDEADSLESLKNILVHHNLEVYSSSNGEEAIEKTKQFEPDIVLLDLLLPSINGLKVAEEIRNLNLKTKIIMISALRSPEVYKEAVKYEIFKFITKPVYPDDLINVIYSAIRQG